MARIRQGQKSALLVIDVQNGVVATCHDKDRIVGNIGKALAHGRDKGLPVVFVQHCSDQELPEGSQQWQLVPELVPLPGEKRIHKRFNSAFEGTELDAVLEGLGITEVILVGAATNWCIRATAFGALTMGYDLVLIGDAHTTEDVKTEEGRVISARDIIDELNIGLNYVEYQGIRNRVLSTKEFLES